MRLLLAIPAKDKKIARKFVSNVCEDDFVMKRINIIRERYGINEEFLNGTEMENNDKWFKLMESKELSDDLKKLIKKRRLPISWLNSLHRFVVGSTIPSKETDDTNVKIYLLNTSKDKGLYLKIEDNTTKRDVLKAWSWIDKNMKRDIKYRNYFSNYFFRDNAVARWRTEGNNPKEVKKKLNKQFGMNLSEEHRRVISHRVKRKN